MSTSMALECKSILKCSVKTLAVGGDWLFSPFVL